MLLTPMPLRGIESNRTTVTIKVFGPKFMMALPVIDVVTIKTLREHSRSRTRSRNQEWTLQ